MKKFVLSILAFMVLFTISACTKDSQPDSGSTTDTTVTITFVQEGEKNIVKTLTTGDSLLLTEIPVPVSKVGYNVVWSVTDFSSIKSDLTVTAVATAKEYTVLFKDKNGTELNTPMKVTYDSQYSLPTAGVDEYRFLGWTYEGKTIENSGIWKIDGTTQIEVIAIWGTSNWTENF